MTYAKIVVTLDDDLFTVECSVDLEVGFGGEFLGVYEFEIAEWHNDSREEPYFTDSEEFRATEDRLYDRINQSKPLMADLYQQAVNNYDPTVE